MGGGEGTRDGVRGVEGVKVTWCHDVRVRGCEGTMV